MKNHGKILTALLIASTPALGVAANQTYPSFGFVQEMAGVTANGDIRADIYNSTGYPSHLRIGAFGGEVIVDPVVGSIFSTGIGYKHPLNRNMAAYGKLYIESGGGASINNITLGFSYTGDSGDFIYNGNAELFSCSNCTVGGSESFVDLKGGGFYRLQANSMGGKTYLGGELDLRLSPSPTESNLFLGARWQPRPSVLIDLGLAASTAGTTTIATPAFVRLNLGL